MQNISPNPAVLRKYPRAGHVDRPRLLFRAVNRRGSPDFQPGMQRHHLLPRQLLARACFSPMFEAVGIGRIGFDDFRSNGLLLPCEDAAAARIGLPLHRGPHRAYSDMVAERVGAIEAGWSRQKRSRPETARRAAVMRLRLLQKALRRRLLETTRRLYMLNRHDPLGANVDFTLLDAMADLLWAGLPSDD